MYNNNVFNNEQLWAQRVSVNLYLCTEKCNSSPQTEHTFPSNTTVSCPRGSHCRWAACPASAAVSTTAQAQADTSPCITAGSWFRLADPHTLGSCRGNKTQIPRQPGCHLSLQCKYDHIKALLLVNHTKLLRIPQLLRLLITSCIGTKASGKWRDIRVNCLTHRQVFSFLEHNIIKSSNKESSLHHSSTLLCWVVQVPPQPVVSNGWSEPRRLLDDDRVCLVSVTRGSL